MSEDRERGTHGGKRRDAGRPPRHGERGQAIQCWLPPTLAAWALEFANQQGESRSGLVVRALEAMRSGSPAGQPVPAADGSAPAAPAARPGPPEAPEIGRASCRERV